MGIMAIVAIASTAMQVMGQIQAGKAQQEAANYNAQIARQNAVMARQQAEEEERRFRVQTRKELGSMRTGYGASGVTIDGAPMDVLEDAAYIAELDALTIRQKGRQQSLAYQNEARLQKLQGSAARTNSYFGAASSVLAAGSKMYSAWPS